MHVQILQNCFSLLNTQTCFCRRLVVYTPKDYAQAKATLTTTRTSSENITSSFCNQFSIMRPCQGRFRQATWAKNQRQRTAILLRNADSDFKVESQRQGTEVVWTSLAYCDFLRASKLIEGHEKQNICQISSVRSTVWVFLFLFLFFVF